MSFEEIYGSRHAAQRQAFLREMADIEQAHLDFFLSRPHPIKADTHDSIDVHYVLYVNELGQTLFGFPKDSELPREIRDQCQRAFERCFY